MILCEAIAGRVAGTRVLTEAEAITRGFEKRPGILGYVEGILSVCDVENKNERVYERSLWEGVLESNRYRKMIEDMTLLGEPDHPETRTQSVIREGSHTIVEMHLDGKYLKGTVAIFDNTLGRIVWPMLQAGVKLGFSTRGDGDLIESRDAKTRVDPKTYEYHGTDFVLNPSFVEAGPTGITEEVRVRVRKALTEAVELKQLTTNEEEVKKDVEALFESAAPSESVEDVVKAVPKNKGLESALVQLEQAQSDVFDRDARLTNLTQQFEEQKDALQLAQQRIEQLERSVRTSRQRLTQEQVSQKESVGRESQKVAELQKILRENQEAQTKFASTHRKLTETVTVTGKKYRRSVQVIETLRGQLKAAQQQLHEAEGKTAAAKKTLQEQSDAVPQAVQEETLKQYKKLRTDNIEVPADHKPLLESASSEAEVDTVIESIRNAQASRYPFLPIKTENRAEREELANHLTEEETRNSDGVEDEDSADVRRAARAQHSR